jgi:threonine aldolase
MRQAMFDAIVGDDVYEDDTTVQTLEHQMAQLLKKEAALFVPSGTMGNQIAIMTHTQRGDEIIVGQHSHIKTYEVGATAVLSGVSFHPVPEIHGMLDHEAVRQGIRAQDIHFPTTRLICLENAHGHGQVGSLEAMAAVHALAQKNSFAVHLDGARLFNAAVHLQVEPSALAQYADSVMVCLSKGLASPIGSLLVGEKAFIQRARKYRKMLGGGMRQVGVLAAAGLVALNDMRLRLKEDHEHARYLAEALDQLEGFSVEQDALDINMVFVKVAWEAQALHKAMKEAGFLLGGYKGETLRLVCHNDITKADIDRFLEAIQVFISTVKIA